MNSIPRPENVLSKRCIMKFFLFFVFFVVLSCTQKVFSAEELEHNAFGYFEKIGIPEANRVFKEENTQVFMPRIVRGEAADIVQNSYQVGLIVSIQDIIGIGICGGSLISGKIIATAAHCWFDGLHQGTCMTAVLGSGKLFSGGTRIKTCEVYTHNEWKPVQALNDVAVVHLPTHVTFSDTVAPIPLPSPSEVHDDFVGESVVASGFGRTGEYIPVTNDQVLSKVNLTVISNEECLLTYPQVISPSNICARGSGNVCMGDSGGPLVLTKNGDLTLIGITSFGFPGGCSLNFPSGYSRVSSFLDFLKKHINMSD